MIVIILGIFFTIMLVMLGNSMFVKTTPKEVTKIKEKARIDKEKDHRIPKVEFRSMDEKLKEKPKEKENKK